MHSAPAVPEPDAVDLTDLDNTAYWVNALGVTLESLRRLTDEVGTEPDAIRAELGRIEKVRMAARRFRAHA